MKLHDEELDTEPDLVRRLLQEQDPQWADLPIAPWRERGTDHAIYRLGDHLAVRLPTIHWAAAQPVKEHRWLPIVAAHVPLAVPVPLALGQPGAGYPYHWSVVPWLRGERASEATVPDPAVLIAGIVGFTQALQTVDPGAGPAPIARDAALIDRDPTLRAAAEDAKDLIDSTAVLASWEQSLAAPSWDRCGVWVHGDLAAGNVLSHNGHLTAVIDWGAACVADPARDVLCAWTFYGGRHASQFRAAFNVDDPTWLRARGFALSGAVESVAYYRHRDPSRALGDQQRLDLILADR